MRTLVTIALAVVAGVHCSASPYTGGETAGDEPAVTEEPATTKPVSGSKSGTPTTQEEEESDPRWAIEAEGLPPTVFTSSVRGDDGALYAAGTFAGSLTVGDDTLWSKGADDVVLVRVDENSHIAWVKAIGSVGQERSPKVTFVDGTVRIMAETEGEVDCGSGKMGRWSSEMFFYCLFAIDGTARGGGTFPTGAP